MKTLEVLVILTFIAFLVFLLMNHLNFILTMTHKYYSFLNRFYTGRYLIKKLTESYPYSIGICNLTASFFNLSNNSTFITFLKENNIKFPVKLKVQYINKTDVFEIGGTEKEYIEFRRVCYSNGILYIVILEI